METLELKYNIEGNVLEAMIEAITTLNLNRYGQLDILTGLGSLRKIWDELLDKPHHYEISINTHSYNGVKFKLHHLHSFDSGLVSSQINKQGLPLTSYDILVMVGSIVAIRMSVEYES